MRPVRRRLTGRRAQVGHEFGITPGATLATALAVVNTAPIDDESGNLGKQQAVTMTSSYIVYGPQVLKEELKTMIQAYKVVIEHDNQEGYVATFPELVGCQAQADSLKALMERIRETLAHHPDVGEPAAAPRPAVPDREPAAGKGDGQHLA